MKALLFAALVFCASCASGPTSDDAPASTLMVIGTLHGKHLEQCGYPLASLGHAIELYAPDLVLTEIRPDALEEKREEDGPLEMTYVAELARHAGIPLAGVDWWEEKTLALKPGVLPPADRLAYERERKSLWSLVGFPPSFARAHNPMTDEAILKLKNLQNRMHQDPGWRDRQAHIDNQVIAAIAAHQSKRALLFIGLEHRPEVEFKISGSPIKLVEPRAFFDARKLVADEPAPPFVVDEWKAGLKRLKHDAKRARGPLRVRLREKIKIWKTAIAQAGSCRIPED